MRFAHLPTSLPAKILLIDDSAIEFAVLRRVLAKGTGWTVEWASSGEAGLQRLRAMPDQWDLVLLDLLMPGMDGIEVMTNMSSDRDLAQLPVIVLTASDDDADQVRALEAGADDYLRKPVVPEIARARVRSVLEMARHRNDLEGLARERAAQLAHADRLVSLGTLAAGMAHEINNPLTFLSGNLQMLEKFSPVLREELQSLPGWNPSRRVREVLDEFPSIAGEMRSGIQRIQKIVSSLKSFSRSGGGRRDPVDLSEVVRNSLVLCAHHLKGLVIQGDGLSYGVLVAGDAQELEQIVVNLLVNAADAIREGSRDEDVQHRIVIATWCQGARSCLSIQDDGPGIPPEVLDRLGTPFFTTKGPGKGTGLGLSISQGIARAHGGELRPQACDEGALFLLDLPRLPEPKGAMP
ncbi:MAG: response regulator [Fibrobacteria bacterium]|nr:response regulator [Fibrobacteria bacterium]